MSSLFGDDGIEDLLNGNLQEDHELPGDDEDRAENEGLFAEGGDGEDGAGDGDDKAIKVEPKKRSVRNPRLRLTVETLRGPRGIQTIEEYFKDIKFKGKGHEKENLDEIIRRMQHWAHRMYPTYKFDDVLTNIERLGKKKPLQVHMSRYRLGMLETMKVHGDGEINDDDDELEGNAGAAADEPFDEFDALLGEQIAMSKLVNRTPAANSSFASVSTNATPSFSRGNAVMSTPISESHELDDSVLARPLPPSQPSTPVAEAKTSSKELTAEQRARMEENRRIALERLQATKARLMQQKQQEQAGSNHV